MTTNELIDRLSAHLEPVDHRQVTRTLGSALALAVLAAIGAMWLTFGVRPDIKEPGALIFLIVKLVFAGSVVAITFVGLLKLARPGKPRRAIGLAAAFPFAVIAVLAAVTLLSTPSAPWDELIIGHVWSKSPILIPIMAIVPYALIVWATRKAAPTQPVRTGALAGLVAGGIGAGAYALSCTEDSLPFVACWYGGMIVLCAILGALFGPRLLRW